MLRLLPNRRATAVLIAAVFLSSCSEKKETNESLALSPSFEEQLPGAPAEHHLEFDVALSGDTIYACWAQLRPAEAVYDIWFSSADVGAGLTAAAERLTDTPEDSRRPALAVNSAGHVTVVWAEGTSPSRAIQIIERDETTGLFGAVGTVADNTADNENARCHYDLLDNLHIVWDVGGEVMYRRRPDGGSMGAAATVPRGGAAGGSDPIAPDIASDANGNVFIVWQHRNAAGAEVLRAASSDDNGLTFPNFGELPGISSSYGLYEPRIARTAIPEQLCVVYRIGTTTVRRVRMSRFSDLGATLQVTRDLFIDSSDSGIGGSPVIATLINGSATSIFACWEQDGKIRGRASVDNGSSFGPIAEFTAVGSGTDGTARRPALAVDGARLLAAWDAENTATGTVRAGFFATSPAK